jgi:hypothetical protein
VTTAARTAAREHPGRTFRLPQTFSVVHSDLPEGLTIDEYRKARPRAERRRFGRRR